MWNAEARRGQPLYNAYGRQIVHGHHGAWQRRHLCDGKPRGPSAFEPQVAGKDGSRLEAQVRHGLFIGFPSRHVRFELGPAGDKSNSAVPFLVEVPDHLRDPGRIVDLQCAHIVPRRTLIEKRDGDFPAGKLRDQPPADFRSHDRDAGDVVSNHAAGGFLRAARIVVRVTQNGVVIQLTGAIEKPLDDFGEKGIFDVRNDDSERAGVTQRQASRMNIGKVSEALYRGENQILGLRADLARFVQHIGDRGSRDTCRERNFANGHSHKNFGRSFESICVPCWRGRWSRIARQV